MTELALGLVTSGRGTMLRFVHEACETGRIPAQLRAVVSNVECPAISVAESLGIRNASVHRTEKYPSQLERDRQMAESLVSAGVDFVLVAGYSERLSPSFVECFPDRVISPYPSVLPAFRELDEAIGPALSHGCKVLGMTIHMHEPDSLSDGPIIAQETIPIDIDDTIDSVVPRLVELEMRMMWDVLNAFASQRVVREGHRIRIIDAVG